MKRVLLIALLVSIMAVGAAAESQIKPAIYAGGGIALPLGPTAFKDYWKMGFGFGGGVGFGITPNIEIVGKVFYTQFSIDDEKLLEGTTGITIDGGDWQSIEFGADVKYLFTMAPDSKIGPYLVAGAGMANSKIKDVTVSGGGYTFPLGSASATDLMFNGGAGVEFMMSPTISIWVDGRFVYVSTEGDATTYLPVRAGLKIGFGGGNGNGM